MVNVVMVEHALFGVIKSVTRTVYVPAESACAVWLLVPATLPLVVPRVVVVPLPSNHSTLNCPATGTTPPILMVTDPFGVTPVQLVLLIVAAAVTAGLT
jgi:hypothetical protein